MSESLGKDRLIVYVDGFNLYHGLHEAARCELLWLDLVKLAKSLRPESSLVQVKYFTAMVRGDPGAQSRQDRYISSLRALHPGAFTAVMGKYMEKRRRCRNCEASWTTYEEKQTDVNIAVHLVADVAARRADTYMLLTADTDVIPAVRMAASLDPQATILAQFPPRRESSALKRMMRSSRQITLATIRAAQIPDVAVAPNGKTFSRPEKWKPLPEGAPAEATVNDGGHRCPSPAHVATLYKKP
ncbi:NYN domain-containing protein [Leucobacter allii]|uniref:NYN domain-containing protein n=1 Tax=Leucobacter allii TaxID=2932247 RepID=UPI001FD46861|nr:NYN domain-containing protein [Leucobacter allii]UOR02047.1 NYN domain-containing protein [Leucobacter allii]